MITLRQVFIKTATSIKSIIFVILAVLMIGPVSAQTTVLKLGFDKAEYIELIRMHARLYDTTKNKIPYPVHFKSVYNSPTVGMENRWDLWSSKKSAVAVINLRGTTTNPVSWLENFYAAMVPASGLCKNF
ncbi:hypothetical protein [Dyadobacter sp. 3J3]|uniref:hypothetical protein n=1 Tax=Dyadobacter sp. 3J3 TaxID=2606600 RepID=UPI00190F33A2|nr:hypothetical protein [Dyadobacter sp. 3J3]